ncbi:MAG TPA: FtsX-like permease family protein [Ramlibacter sp.]|nr:FtsX-like permease family protein [Ramlibacter sp.]
MEIRPILSALLRQKTGPLLVAIQVAISLAILANALFIVSERIATSERPSGIGNENDVGYLQVFPLKKPSHNEILAQRQTDLRAIRAIPGVKAAAMTSQMPMSRSGSQSSVRVNPGAQTETASPAVYQGEEDFVRTMGLKLLEGRDITAQDITEHDADTQTENEGFPKNVLVSLSLARLMFPDATTYTGRRFYFGLGTEKTATIVGVIERLQSPGASAKPTGEHSVILPMRVSHPFWRYVVRAEPGQLDRVLREADETLRKIAPAPVAVDVRTVAKDRHDRYRNERAMAWMLVAVSVLLLLITLSGIVGMTMLRVAQRRKQIGVRRALGATWRDIMRYFITENLMITTGGIVAGLLLAIALNQLLMRQVQMGKLPLEYLAYGAALLWVLGVASVYGPASRAASTSPAIATRTV